MRRLWRTALMAAALAGLGACGSYGPPPPKENGYGDQCAAAVAPALETTGVA